MPAFVIGESGCTREPLRHLIDAVAALAVLVKAFPAGAAANHRGLDQHMIPVDGEGDRITGLQRFRQSIRISVSTIV